MVSERKSDILPPKKAYVSKIMEKDLTSGSVLKNILFFSLPYMLSFFLQTLYGMADLFIIGQFNATDSITAVSIGSQVMHMITVMIVGLAIGRNRNHWTCRRGKGNKKSFPAGGKYRHFVCNRFFCRYRTAASFGKTNCGRNVYAFGSNSRHLGLSQDLLCRHSIYYCLQYSQFHLPGPWRRQKAHVFCRSSLRLQYCP